MFKITDFDIEEMDVRKIIELSIKSEQEAQKTYEEFLERDIPEDFKNRIKASLKDEKDHEKFLRNLFNDWYPDETPKLEKDSVNIEGQIELESNELPELLEKAMKDEKNAEETYSKLGDKIEDKPKSRTFKHLAHMEREHFETLKSELEGLKE